MDAKEASSTTGVKHYVVAKNIDQSKNHGLSNIFDHSNCNWLIRVVWLLALLTSLYFIIKAFITYTKYETSVTIENIYETPTDFPAVTICNLNPINESTERSKNVMNYFLFPLMYNKSNEIYMNISNCSFGFGDWANIYGWMKCWNYSTIETIDLIINTIKSYVSNNVSSNDLIQFGYQYKNMRISDSFNKKPISYFTEFRHPNYGNCYTFNDGTNESIWRTNKVGSDYGLTLELLVSASK
jgi:hypothetical protein